MIPVITAWCLASGLMLSMAFIAKDSEYFSRLWAITWFSLGLALLIANRLAFSLALTGLAERGKLGRPTLIVGAGENGVRLAHHLNHSTDIMVRVVGFVDDRRTRRPEVVGRHPMLGDIDCLIDMVRRDHVDLVLLALPWSANQRIREIMDRLSPLPVDVRLAPDLVNFNFPNPLMSEVAGLPMVRIFDRPISGWSQFLKAVEDRVIAGLLLIFLLPFLVLVAVAIMLDSPGPILFRQKRYGFNQKIINVLKFRTMYHHMQDADCKVQTRRNDSRVTRIGRHLRKYSIDELPQLWNVLVGEMSLVGPRPHAIASNTAGRLFEDMVEHYAARHKVRPGMTGWAQVNGWRGEVDTVEKLKNRVECDLYYINNWSVGFDLWIMLRTIPAALSDKNAF